jgi:Xaa-Pro aminopeptidase
MNKENLLMVADSQHDANMLYAVRMFVPDPFIYLRVDGKPHIIMSDLEIDRARKQARHCKILSLGDRQKPLLKKGSKKAGFAQVIRAALKEKGIKKVFVPANFPHGLAEELRKLKVKLKIKEDPFFPDRQIKNLEEVKKISAALMMAEVGLAEAIQAL